MKLESIYGGFAAQMQIMINVQLAMFAPVWYKNYFSFAPKQQSLTYSTVVGAARIEAAASIVSRNAATPQRSRADLAKYQGEIPAIKEMIPMNETDYRDFLAMQNLPVSDDAKKQQLLDYLFGDVKKVGDAAHKRLDIMALEAVSTGKISLTVDNNPDGLVLGSAVDLLMPDANKKTASVSWDNAATAKPIVDIETVKGDAMARGISFSKILMSPSMWQKFRNTTEVKDTMGAFYYGPKVQGNPTAVTTLTKVNEYLTEQLLPIIEIVDVPIGIEKDGKINTIRPFSENNVAFIPVGELGKIKNAIAIEEIQPVGKVNYATFDNALISKWSDNEPFAEWTKVELNACPSLEAVDSIYLLTAVPA